MTRTPSTKSAADHPPRAIGEARVSVKVRDGATVLTGLRQQGSLKVVFPHRSGAPDMEAVVVNTAGGITGGDQFSLTATAEAGSDLTITTQAAERAYRAQTGSQAGRLSTRLHVETGARLTWSPQETILFDGCHLQRRNDIDVADGGRLLFVEPVIFGRAAMGEALTDATFADQLDIRVNGDLVYADRSRLDGDLVQALGRAGVANGCGAMASLVFIAPNAEAQLTPVREILNDTSGVSLLQDTVLVARFLAADGFELRRTLVPVLTLLKGAPLPKPWMI